MKKTIKILAEKMEKLQEKKDGTLQGGFSAIKGGFNTEALGSTNVNGCTNQTCTGSTNGGGSSCSNGSCAL